MEVSVIDTQYLRPHMDASHLLVSDGRAALVDTGTFHSVPHLLDAVHASGLALEAIDYIFLTHIHLDHAGGAGRLAKLLPHAKIVVHPRGAAHLMDPSRLVAATKAVYGEHLYNEYYGELLPVPVSQLIEAADGQNLRLGRTNLEFIHTPGHALHHLCIVDAEASRVFTGDTFGVSYREFDTAAGEFIFPTTSPTQFDPAQLQASIETIRRLRPKTVHLTHYGPVEHVARAADDLQADIEAFVRIARQLAAAPDRRNQIAAALFEHLSARLDAHGAATDLDVRHRVLDADIELNAAGLDAWLLRAGWT
jgi:glyoxylase-like metal-dependent hydrolase (beta-lactamase superfamily II)